ncbi:MAG: hypothetical protein GY906_12190 [bacterium]|nr:hypothetical protein [bacterium]
MAYETGSATSIEDLIDKLFTFATGLATTTWVEDELDLTANYGTLHYGNCYVSFRWDATAETDLAVYQSLGWTSSTEPHNQDDDSGAGDTTIPIDSSRRVNFMNTGPYVAYHFFAGEGSTPYIHIAVEVDTGRFRHFGFGNIIKLGTWTGGEYAYAHFWSPNDEDNPIYTQHVFGLDGIYTGNDIGATLHIEDFDDQSVDEKWAMFCSRPRPAGTDRAGEDRAVIRGGARGGFWGYYMNWIDYSSPNAYKPMAPIAMAWYDTAGSPDTWIWLGEWPDVAIINIGTLTAAQELTVGLDTWMVFPWVRKQYLLDGTEESWNAGIAYKKIT